MKIWASHPKPKDGELLSSWLVRLAAAGGMSAVEFCKTTLSITKANLKLIDRNPNDSLLSALADGTGVPIERIRETSLQPEEGYVWSLSGIGEFQWLIPSLTVHSKIDRFTSGMAYCPECLYADETAYYRKL